MQGGPSLLLCKTPGQGAVAGSRSRGTRKPGSVWSDYSCGRVLRHEKRNAAQPDGKRGVCGSCNLRELLGAVQSNFKVHVDFFVREHNSSPCMGSETARRFPKRRARDFSSSGTAAGRTQQSILVETLQVACQADNLLVCRCYRNTSLEIRRMPRPPC